MRRTATHIVILVVTGVIPPGCSLLVDPEVAMSSGSEGGSPACSFDDDCVRMFGPDFTCERNACFGLTEDAPRRRIWDRDITEDTTWFADTVYELREPIFVEGGATLEIRPGTRIEGARPEAALIVTREGRVHAEGRPNAPIVFTSSRRAGARRAGDWGGVALLGRAPVNAGVPNLDGLPRDHRTLYGDTVPDPEHDCGTLAYVRIEFGGYTFSPGAELDGLTLAGCGDRTEVGYVQVHLSRHDGVSVLGGTVGLRHLVISLSRDDSLHWDQGWRGWAQHVAILQGGRGGGDLYAGGDCSLDGDSNTDTYPLDPRSRPRLYNFTLIGADHVDATDLGLHLGSGSSAELRNFLVMNHRGGFWDLDGPSVHCPQYRRDALHCGREEALVMKGLALYELGLDEDPWTLQEQTESDDGGFDEAAYLSDYAQELGLMWLSARDNGGPKLWQPLLGHREVGPLLEPLPDSPLVLDTWSPYPDAPPSVDTLAASYIGAFEADRAPWSDGWTAFPEN